MQPTRLRGRSRNGTEKSNAASRLSFMAHVVLTRLCCSMTASWEPTSACGAPLSVKMVAARADLSEPSAPLRLFSSLLYRILLIWTQSGGGHDPGVRDRVF